MQENGAFFRMCDRCASFSRGNSGVRHYGSLQQVPAHVCTIIATSMFAVLPLDSTTSILYYFHSSGATFSLKIPFGVWYFHDILLRFSGGNGLHGYQGKLVIGQLTGPFFLAMPFLFCRICTSNLVVICGWPFCGVTQILGGPIKSSDPSLCYFPLPSSW